MAVADENIDAPQVDDQQPDGSQPSLQVNGNGKLEQYYNYLKKSGADVAPTLQSFQKTLSDDKTAQTYYNYLKTNHFDAPPNYQSFVSTLGIKTNAPPEHQIVHSDQQNNDFLVGQAQDRLQQHITGNAKEAAQEIYANEFAQATKDLANGKITVDQFKTARDNYVNNRVNVEHGNDKMVNQSQSDPYAQGIILKHVVRNNPQAGNQIKQDVALVSARDRLATHGDQIRQNIEGIKKGDLDVDLSSGQVIKPVGLWQSTVNSLRDNLNAHSEFLWNKNHTDQEIADKYLGESEYINPDKPLEVPKGVGGKIGEFLGGNLPITTGGFALGAVEKLLPEANWAKAASLGANSAMVGTDMYMVGHANSMKEHFWENMQNGMKPEDAVKDARVKANYDASVDATSGVIMGAIASMGDVGEVKLSPETRGFARGLYNEGKNLLKYATPEAAATGLISVASQEAKNAQNGAQNNDGLSDAAWAGVLLPFAFRFGGAGSKLIKGDLWNSIKGDISKMPEGVVNANIDNAVQSGQMNPKDASDLKDEFANARQTNAKVPIHITDPATRAKISDLMDKYDDEQAKLDVAHDVYKPAIKARMDEIKTQVNDLSGTQPQENIRTKKVDFDQTAIAKDLLNEKIKEGKDFWTKIDIYTGMAKADPEEFLKFISDQDRGSEQSSKEARGAFGDELTDAANNHVDYSLKNKEDENKRIDQASEGKQTISRQQVENNEGAAEKNNLLPESAASSSIPQHEKIQTDKNLRTLDYGDFKGQKEDDASNEQIRQDILNDVPVGKSGEKFSDFLKRSIPAIRNIIEDKDNNSVIVTHSSVIKALKVWEQMGRPENIEGQKLKDFAQAYVDMKPKREGDVQVLKGGNGTATQVVRHGETEDNKISDFREDNTELTDRGIEQAKKAGKSVNEVVNGDVAKVVASDLPRTVHTANLIMDEVEGKNNSQTKNQNDALQEPSTSSVLQHPQETTGETGGERGRVEQQQQGNEPPEKTITGQQPPPVEKGGEGKGEEENTGIKKAITIAERAKRDLGAIALSKLGSDAESLQRGKEAVDSGRIDPREVVDRVIKDNGIYTPEEAEAMQYYAHQLKAQENDIRSEINAAPKDSFERDNAIGQLQQHSDEMDAFTQANRINSRAWSNLGNIMQIEADPSFNPANVRTIIKENYGGEIPKDVQDRIDSVLKERDSAIDELRSAKEKMALDDIKKDSGFEQRQTKRQQTKEQLKKEREDILSEIKKAIKKDLGNLNAGIPIPTETLTAIGKLAVNYFKDGVNTIEGLTDKIYQDLKEFNVDKKAIREAISNYSVLREQAHEAQLGKLATKEKSLNTQIEKGEPKRAPIKSNIIFNKSADMIKAEQRIFLAEKKLRDIKRQSFDSQKNWYQKGLMWLGRGFRISILSGTNVLEKLASAASIGGALKRIPEQAIGGIYRNVFRGIAEKAPIEGGLNANSEASFYKEFFNPKKFADNSWQILRHGESRLTQKMGGSGFEHVPILYLPTDLHQVIKDPVKRATFEASFRNGLNFAEKQGYDINDPLILNSIENAAYKRANYEIFQESNAISRAFNKWKGKMESGTAEFEGKPIGKNLGATGKFLADFMIPVSTVPVNIARRVASTSPLGMIRGIGKVANAYRKGIENLAPEEADAVMRQLKQGTLGTALWLTGWFGAKSFGGLWTQFNPDKKRKASDLVSDQMEVNGEKIPKPVQHALPLEVIQTAATARRIYDLSTKKGDNTFEAMLKAGLGSIGAVAGDLPVVQTPVHIEEAATTPYGEKKLKEDVESRFEPAILKETGVIPKDKKGKTQTTTQYNYSKPILNN